MFLRRPRPTFAINLTPFCTCSLEVNNPLIQVTIHVACSESQIAFWHGSSSPNENLSFLQLRIQRRRRTFPRIDLDDIRSFLQTLYWRFGFEHRRYTAHL